MNQIQPITKKGFVLYSDSYEIIKDFSNKDKANLLDAFFLYSNGQPIPQLSPTAAIVFAFVRQSMDRDFEKYLKRCEKNKKNIEKRWSDHKKAIPDNTIEYDRIQMNTNDTDTTQHNKDTTQHKESKVLTLEEQNKAFEWVEKISNSHKKL